MASISEEDIQKVREASDIVSVFSERVVMRQKGNQFWCCCPFHEERTPSCKVDPVAQAFYCFGCHEGGDVFSYVMKSEDISFPDAVRRLAERAGVEIKESERGSMPQSYKARLKEACKDACDFYHMQLMHVRSTEADAARAYMGGRGLGGEVPNRWVLGFAPGHRALLNHLRSKGYSDKELIDANLVISTQRRGIQDRFFNRIMFPIFDDQGDCIAFGGRVVGKGEPKYLNTGETPLFHKSNVLFGLDKAKASMTATGTALVVEGYTDVIALHEAGMSNAVATLGTALTKQHIRLLSRHAGRKIIYLFDGDAAGQRAADRALEFIGDYMTPESGRKQIELCACTLPDNLDPADFVAQRGVEDLKSLLDSAPSLISYGIDRRIASFDTNTAEGRSRAFASAISVLAPIKDSLLAKDYAVQIASRLRFRENDALERLEKLQPPRDYNNQHAKDASGATAPSNDARSGAGVEDSGVTAPEPLSDAQRNRCRFEMHFLGLCARNPALGEAYSGALASVQWHVPLFARVAERLLDIFAEQHIKAASEIIGLLTLEFPKSARIFVETEHVGEDASALLAYLAEELAIGDLEDAVAQYRSQLSQSQAFSPEEYDLLFQTVATLQQEIVARRQAHTL